MGCDRRTASAAAPANLSRRNTGATAAGRNGDYQAGSRPGSAPAPKTPATACGLPRSHPRAHRQLATLYSIPSTSDGSAPASTC
jgi:hypothetical protein